MQTLCDHCGKQYNCQPARFKKHKKHYCSKECSKFGQRSNRFTFFLAKAKERSKRDNIYFDLKLEDLENAWTGRCALTKVKLYVSVIRQDNRLGKANASIDRKDSNKGYVADNIQGVCKEVNAMKWNLPQSKFIEICKLVATNN